MTLANRTLDRFPPMAVLAALALAALLLAPVVARGDSLSTGAPPAQYRGPSGESPSRVPPILDTHPAGQGGTTRYPEGFERWEFWFEHEKDALLRAVIDRASSPGTTETPGPPLPTRGPLDLLTAEDRAERVLPALRAALRDGDRTVRASAALALGEAGDASSLPHLAGMLRNAAAPERRTAALALGFLRGADAATALVRALEDDPDAGVRSVAAVGIGLTGHLAAGPALRDALARGFESSGREAREVRVAIVDGIGLLGDREAVPTLQRLLLAPEARDDRARAHAAAALGRIGDPAAVAPLLRALQDDDAGVRRAAALALGAFRDPAVAAALRRSALDGSDPLERGYAAISLARSAGAEAVPTLAPLTAPKFDRSVRGFAAVALGLTGAPKEAAPHLRALLELRSEDSVRGAAAVGLGLLGDSRSAPDLARTAYDAASSAELRGYAILALAMTGDATAGPAVRAALSDDSGPYARRPAALAAGLRPFPGAPGLLVRTLLEARDPSVRGAALLGLGMAPDRAALPLLAEIAGDASAPAAARIGAVTALGQLSMDGRLPPVARVASGVDFRSLTPVLERVIRVF